MVVPVDVRLALASGEIDGDATSITCPVLITQGLEDEIVLPSMSQAIKAQIPDAELFLYPGTGHTTYGEASQRFNNELARFVRNKAAN